MKAPFHTSDRSGMRIQYASDLHLDATPNQPFGTILSPRAPLLVLAGDLCPVEHPLYASFLRWCSQNWQTVLVVAGNHEYFCENVPKTITQIDEEIRAQTRMLPNVVFLQGGEDVEIQGLRFVGATLWSDLDPTLWKDPALLKKGDYTHTGVDPGRLTQPADTVRLYQNQKGRILSAIQTSSVPVVVLTHHLPSFQLMPLEFQTSVLKSAYASPLESLMGPKVKAWICGHSHVRKQWVGPGGTLCCLNPRGYPGQESGFQTSVLDLSL